MYTYAPSGNINTVTFEINLYAQWLSEYGRNWDAYAMFSGNINMVPEIIKPISLVAISIHTPNGNINVVLEI